MSIASSTISLGLALFAVALAEGQIIPTVETSDTNGDGDITLAEFQSSWRDFLMNGDTDGDGRISAPEWQAEAVKISQRMRDNRVSGWASIGHNGLWYLLDVNQDKYVTPDEIDVSTRLRFGRFDTDGDGVITPAEASAFRNRATGGVPPSQ